MEKLHNKGVESMEKGDIDTALRFFHEALELEPDVDDMPTLVSLWLDCAVAYTQQERWHLATDKVILVLSYDRGDIHAWIQLIIALCHLGLTCVAEEVLDDALEESLECSPGFIINCVRHAFDGASPCGKVGMIEMIRTSPATWLTIKLGTRLLEDALSKKKFEALKELTDSGVLLLFFHHLAEIQESHQISNMMVSLACTRAYDKLSVAVDLFHVKAVELLLDSNSSVLKDTLKSSLKIRLPTLVADKEGVHMQVHISQLEFILRVQNCIGLEKTLEYFATHHRVINTWAAYGLRCLSGGGTEDNTDAWELVTLMRLSIFLKTPEAIMEANATLFIVKLLESWARMGPRWRGSESNRMLQLAFDLGRGLCSHQRGRSAIYRTLKGPIFSEAWIRGMAERFDNHWDSAIKTMGKDFIYQCFDEATRKDPGKEVATALRRFCHGRCNPAKQETKANEFLLYYVPGGRHYYCSDQCFNQAITIEKGSEECTRSAIGSWTSGMAHLDKVNQGKELLVLQRFAEAMLVNINLPRVSEASVQKAYRELSSMGQMLSGDEFHSVYSFVINCFELRKLFQHYDLAALLGHQWLKDSRIDAAQEMLSTLSSLIFDLRSPQTTDHLVKFDHKREIIRVLFSFLRKPADYPDKLCFRYLFEVRCMELQSVIILHILWQTDDIYKYVVDILRGWASRPYGWERPHSLFLHGQLFALLAFLGENHGCIECMKAGAYGWLGSWSSLEELGDSQELGFSDVLRWLAQARRDGNELCAAADVAEAKRKKMQREEEERWRCRISPELHDFCKRFPFQALHLSAKNQCQSCNKRDKECRKTSKNGLLLCTRCQRVSYCSTDCQNQDWQWHKKWCTKMPEKAKPSFLGKKTEAASLKGSGDQHPHFHLCSLRPAPIVDPSFESGKV